ncbi:ferredoxin [Gordonia sp. CPCC 206044]|uniref:ferredoxin n=1 Tax=Gordonia sp. CPCC 206044 TaxID=3140793 RepID=UPI003AF374AB
MRVRVDNDVCQGHTLCWMTAPDYFVLDEVDGHATAVDEEIPVDRADEVQVAIRSCPERAITEF